MPSSSSRKAGFRIKTCARPPVPIHGHRLLLCTLRRSAKGSSPSSSFPTSSRGRECCGKGGAGLLEGGNRVVVGGGSAREAGGRDGGDAGRCTMAQLLLGSEKGRRERDASSAELNLRSADAQSQQQVDELREPAASGTTTRRGVTQEQRGGNSSCLACLSCCAQDRLSGFVSQGLQCMHDC